MLGWLARRQSRLCTAHLFWGGRTEVTNSKGFVISSGAFLQLSCMGACNQKKSFIRVVWSFCLIIVRTAYRFFTFWWFLLVELLRLKPDWSMERPPRRLLDLVSFCIAIPFDAYLFLHVLLLFSLTFPYVFLIFRGVFPIFFPTFVPYGTSVFPL